MKIKPALILFALILCPNLLADLSVTEEVTDKGDTIYREKRWFRDGEKVLVESWITEKQTGKQKIHAQSLYAGGKSLLTIAEINERIAITHPGSVYTLAFTFSDHGTPERISVYHPTKLSPQETYQRRHDGFYELKAEAEPGATDNPGDAQRVREDH